MPVIRALGKTILEAPTVPIYPKKTLSWCLGITLLSASIVHAQIEPDFAAVPYANLGGKDLVFDLYLPDEGEGPFPVVVWIHGGGWSGGTRGVPSGGGALLGNGIAIASIDYRLSRQDGQYGSHSVHWPAQIHDCKGAVRFLRAHADEYGLDPLRVGSYGSSAGGHLSAMLAVSGGIEELEGTVGGNLEYSSRVLASVDFFGPTDILYLNEDVTDPPGSLFDHDAPTSPESLLIGYDQPGQGLADIKANLDNPADPYPFLIELLQSASPYLLVKGDGAKLLIEHGDQDISVPLAQSAKLDQAYTDAGLIHTYKVVAGAGHGSLGNAANLEAVSFFIEHLRDGPVMYGIDMNGDSRVDDSDLDLFRQNPSDLNGDGVADRGDINALVHWVRRHKLKSSP